MIDIQSMVTKNMEQMMQNGEIEKMVDEATTNLVKNAISDALGSWKIKSQIEDKLKEEVSGIVKELDFKGYNTIMFNSLIQILEKQMNLNNLADAFTIFKDAFIKDGVLDLSNLVNEFKNYFNRFGNYSDEDQITLSVKQEDRITRIYIDENENRLSHYLCDTIIAIWKDDDGKAHIYSLRLRGKDAGDIRDVYEFSKIEKVLFNAFINKTNVTGYEGIEPEYDRYYECEEY